MKTVHNQHPLSVTIFPNYGALTKFQKKKFKDNDIREMLQMIHWRRKVNHLSNQHGRQSMETPQVSPVLKDNTNRGSEFPKKTQ